MEREFFLFFSSLCFFLRSTKIGPQVFVGTEGKVYLRDESYAWTQKSWSFVKLHEVGDLSYLVYFRFKCFVDDCVGLFEAVRGHLIGPKTWD